MSTYDNSILRYLILNACVMSRLSACNTLVAFAGKKIIFMLLYLFFSVSGWHPSLSMNSSIDRP